MAPCNMDNGLAFIPGVPGFPPGAFWETRVTNPAAEVLMVGVGRVWFWGDAGERHKKPPAEAGGLRVVWLPGCHAIWV